MRSGRVRKTIAIITALYIALHPSITSAQGAIDSGAESSDVMVDQEIHYYDPSASATCAPASAGVSTVGDEVRLGANEDYRGDPIWSDEDLEKIERHKAVYSEAAEEYDVPWAMLAVIHKRENNLNLTYHSNGQGIYQFYEMAGEFPRGGTASPEDFLRETRMLAEQLQNDYVTRNHPDNAGPLSSSGTPDNVIQDTFFSYNGRASVYAAQARSLGYTSAGEAFHGSPYVMNRADAERDPNVNSTTWGQVKSDGGPIEYPANQDYGAWPYYAAIAGASGCSGGGPTLTMEINGFMYAWPIAPGTQSEHAGLLSDLPCNSPAGCHYGSGTDPAFDMTRAPGGNAAIDTETYAVTNGVLENVRGSYNGQQGCQSFQLFSDPAEGGDGYRYWYGHIWKVPHSTGARVQPGDFVGSLGESRCSCPNCSAPPHLHIDRGYPQGEYGGSTAQGARDPGFVNIINTLFNNLPQ